MLCIHGEVVDPEVDFFEREQIFIANKLDPILAQVPNLKVVIEHATTKEAVAYVENSQHPGGIGCTITPQHLLYNRNALFNKGLNPHFFCLPILKREEDRLELLRAGASGLSRFCIVSAEHTPLSSPTHFGLLSRCVALAAEKMHRPCVRERRWLSLCRFPRSNVW